MPPTTLNSEEPVNSPLDGPTAPPIGPSYHTPRCRTATPRDRRKHSLDTKAGLTACHDRSPWTACYDARQ